MAILPIRTFGDPVLGEVCPEARPDSENLNELIRNLADTMHNAPGVGLAACQIGVLKQVFVFDMDDGLQAFANPKVVWASEETEEEEEGCLSLPDVRLTIVRPAKVKVEVMDMSGNKQTIDAEGLLARVLQHEVDHLNGRLLLARASRSERKRAIKEINQIRMGTEARG